VCVLGTFLKLSSTSLPIELNPSIEKVCITRISRVGLIGRVLQNHAQSTALPLDSDTRRTP
jgi:hypothetical protein